MEGVRDENSFFYRFSGGFFQIDGAWGGPDGIKIPYPVPFDLLEAARAGTDERLVRYDVPGRAVENLQGKQRVRVRTPETPGVRSRRDERGGVEMLLVAERSACSCGSRVDRCPGGRSAGFRQASFRTNVISRKRPPRENHRDLIVAPRLSSSRPLPSSIVIFCGAVGRRWRRCRPTGSVCWSTAAASRRGTRPW